MNSQNSLSSSGGSTLFELWMAFCLFPAAAIWEIYGDRKGFGAVSGGAFQLSVLFMTMTLATAFGGAGLAVWGLLKLLALGLRRTRRRIYYPVEKERRCRLAAERRRIRKRSTVNEIPTAEALRAQFARVKGDPREMIRFGSMLCDLEAYVDNSLRRDVSGAIVGRNAGIKGWLAENCVELAAKYKTVMRYKAMAEQFRQVVGVRDPCPAALALPEGGADAECCAGGECVENDADETTVRTKVLTEESLARAREVAAVFLKACGQTQRGLADALGARLRPESVSPEIERAERLRQGLAPGQGVGEKFVRMFA